MQLPLDITAFDFFSNAPYGTIFIFNGALDASKYYPRYYHKEHGWELVMEPHGVWNVDFTVDTGEEILAKIKGAPIRPEDTQHLLRLGRHMRQNYMRGFRAGDPVFMEQMRSLCDRIPEGSKLILLFDDTRVRQGDGSLKDQPHVLDYVNRVRALAAEYPYVGTVWFKDSIQSEAEIQVGGNHYDRMVYLRTAQNVLDTIRKVPARTADVMVAA